MKPGYLLIFICLMMGCKQQTPDTNTAYTATNYPTTGSIERLDDALDQLISPDATIEILANGFTWTEGPLWVPAGDYLLFSDIPANRINKWTEAEGVVSYLEPSGYTGDTPRGGEPGSNGLLLNMDQQLVLCQHGDRRIALMNSPLDTPKASFTSLAAQYEGMRFNSPNDAVYDRQGNLYFTDPPYGLEGKMDDPAKEAPFQGVYRLAPDGNIKLITDQMSRPNGIGLSPDEQTLYIANSDGAAKLWMAYTIDQLGDVLDHKEFYNATDQSAKGYPDGLKVDPKGNVWATGPGGLWVFSPAGKVLGKILTGEATSNCAFDADYQTLYLTCDDYLMRVRLFPNAK